MRQDDALSSVVSEMLLLALVLILIPSVTITLMNQLPGDRVPTVNIKMAFDGDSVILYHKGGDYLLWDDMKVIVQNSDAILEYHKEDLKPEKARSTFDLGNITRPICASSGATVQLVAKNAVVFSGLVP